MRTGACAEVPKDVERGPAQRGGEVERQQQVATAGAGARGVSRVRLLRAVLPPSCRRRDRSAQKIR